MRTGQLKGSRPAWYDRNPQGIDLGYLGDDLAPHTLTARFTYTVPAGKKAFVETAFARVLRRTPATGVGRVSARIGVRSSYILFAEIATNTAGDFDSMNVGQASILRAGEIIVGNTTDNSTDGTTKISMGIEGIEFDA